MILLKVAQDVNRDMKRSVDRGLRAMFNVLASEAQRTAVMNAPADTGLLRSSIQLFREYAPPSYRAGIVTVLPYALVMEDGRQPGAKQPPSLPLGLWARRKKMMVKERRSVGGTIRVVTRPIRTMGDVLSVGFVLARSIKQKGIKGRGFFRKAEQRIAVLLGSAAGALGIQLKKEWDKGGD